MKRRRYLLAGIGLVGSLFFGVALADSNLWFLSNNNVRPNVGTWGVQINSLGSGGSPCLVVNSSGVISTSTCGGVSAPASPSQGIQYNDNGTMAASSSLLYVTSTKTLTMTGAINLTSDLGTSTAAIVIGTGNNSSTYAIKVAGGRANLGYDTVRANMYLQAGSSIGALKGIDFYVGGDGSSFPSGTIALTLSNSGNATFNKNLAVIGLSTLAETKTASSTNTGNFTNTGNITNTGTFAFTGYSSNPQLFAADTTTGVHFDAPGIVSFHNGGNQTMLLSSTNRVGIGNFVPTAYLTIQSTSTASATNYDLLTIASSSGLLYLNVSSTGQTYIKELNSPSTTVSGTLNAGTLQQGGTGVVLNTRNVNTTSPLAGGGALSGDLTLTCTTCVTTSRNVNTGTGLSGGGNLGSDLTLTNIGVTSLASSSPITVSNATGSVTVSCATCLTSTGNTALSSSSLSFNIYDATSTSPYKFAKWRAGTSSTIDQISCDEFAAQASTTIEVYRADTLGSTAVSSDIVASMSCDNNGTSTTSFVTSTVPIGTFLIVNVTSTAGTPSWATVNIHFKKVQ